MWKLIGFIGGGVLLLAAIVLALVFGAQGCSNGKEALAATQKSGSRLGKVEDDLSSVRKTQDKVILPALAAIQVQLAAIPKGDATAPASAGSVIKTTPDTTSGTASKKAPPAATAKKVVTPAPAPETAAPGSLADHERRISDLEGWRKVRVDPALDRLGEIAKKLEALGVKGAK